MDQKKLEKIQYVSEYCRQVFDLYSQDIQHDYALDQFKTILSKEAIRQRVEQALFNIEDEHAWMKALRVLRAKLMFRWIWQDIYHEIQVMTLTKSLSDFADCCVLAAKKFARQPLISKYGEPLSYSGKAQDLMVIAMGKHGAQELNLSSDIDLIFAFDEQGETDGRKSIDVQQFCILWGQKIIYLLDHMTAQGFVFRVDMRLRPWGDGAPLAISHAGLEKYLLQHGREWERYAWIKARVIENVPTEEATQLLKMTRPFVFRRYIDYSAFDAMRDMKAMIEREVMRRNRQDDIKLGAGGIREIEFIVQVFQLLYGGSRLELQDRQCLVCLDHLVKAQLLNQTTGEQLKEAYLFLRKVEHAIQALNDQQTQTLPVHEEQQQRLICALNFNTWDNFLQVLNHHRSTVQAQFEQSIQIQHTASSNECTHLDVLQAQLNLDETTQKLVQNFWSSTSIKKLPATAFTRLERFWRCLCIELNQHQLQDKAITHLIPLVESIIRRSVYLVMLTENKGALQRLIKMAQVSPWICEELTQYPILLDEFLSMDFVLPTREALEEAIRYQFLRIEIQDIEEILQALRLFKKSAVLNVASADILANEPLMKVSDALTDIAEICVHTTLNYAYKITAQRYGFPVLKTGERCSEVQLGFVIVGYGKLGGIELGYGSDLDLVFLHNLDEQAETNGQKHITGFEFALKVAQKFMSLMTTQTLDGRVYEIDTRLRPSGEAGVLVTSIDAYEKYQKKSAWLWEHQALVRARAIAGDALLKQHFCNIRLEVLTQTRDEKQVQHEIIEMRQKMQQHLGSKIEQKKAGIFHLKQDQGGIVDIEFMAQYIVLAWSGTKPDLAHYSDNIRILESAAHLNCLPHIDAQALIQAYLSERSESHRLSLANKTMQVSADAWQYTRNIVYQLWQKLIDPSIEDFGQ